MLCRKKKNENFQSNWQNQQAKSKTPFVRELLADKSEHAVEKVYAEIGSRHRVKRYHIKIISSEEISVDQIENLILKKIASGE
jgi:ribosomal protein L20A (L18A)